MGNPVSKWFYKERRVRVIMIGLDAAGKTTALYRLKLGEVVTTIPTIGFNVETIEHNDVHVDAWDIGLRGNIRPLMRHYWANTDAVVFVIDSADTERMEEAKELLRFVLEEDEVRDVPLLIMANKQDSPKALTSQKIAEDLGLNELRGRKWYIIPTAATTGEGLREGLDWLVGTLTGNMIKSDVKSSVQTSVSDVKDATRKIHHNAWWYGGNIITKSSAWMKNITGCSVKQ